MTRRTLLALAPAAFLRAQSLPEVHYRKYARCLPDYLSRLAADARTRRELAMSKLTTREAVVDRQKWVRETFWRLTGGEPQRTPLSARTLGGFERQGYKLEKMAYESQPGVVITANLYLPTTGSAPYPGVLFQMGHSPNGKAAALYQKCCQGLARLGYVVLAFDPMGQGERLYGPPSIGPDDQHTLVGRQMLPYGETVTRMQVWDAVRSLDVLAAHPMVDPKRLASTGQSGGGTLTQMLACVDDRLATAAVSCGNTENFACADFNPPGSTDDAEQNFIGSGLVGFDRWDTLYPIAPKPLLVMASARDFFGTYSPNYLADGRAEFKRLANVYEVLGHKEQIQWGETPLPHAFSYALRLAVYNWFERWLKNSDRKIESEPPVSPEPDELLRCTPVTTHSWSLPTVKQSGVSAAALLGLNVMAASPPTVLGRVPSAGIDIEAIEVESDRGVFLPAWRYLPRQPQGPTVLIVESRGRNAHASEDGMYHQLALSGLTVCAGDVRATGDLTPEFSRGALGYARGHADEGSYAWASLILGRPLLTQRVADILALVAAMNGPVVLAANGKITVPALLAAAIDMRISSVFLAGGPATLAGRDPAVENILPGVFLKTDLAQIEAEVAPRKIHRTEEAGWTVEAIRTFVRS